MVDHDLDGRSQSHAWRELHAEGILWDGPVFVVDGASQLPLRLITTSQRLAFTKGGAFMLEVPREWLHPAPHMNPDGSVNLTVDAGEGNRPESLRLIARDGRRLAVDLVAALNRSRSQRPERSLSIYAPEPSGELPEPPVARGRRSSRPPVAPGDEPGSDEALLGHLDPDDFPPLTAAPPRSKPAAAEQDRPAAAVFVSEAPAPSREGDWSLRPIDAMSTRSDRLARRGWAIRLSGLVLLLMLAAAFGSGRMPTLPGRDFASRIPDTGIHAPFSDDDAEPTKQPAVAQVQTPPPTVSVAAQQPTSETKTVADARLTPPPSETAIALGVGGMEEDPDAVTATAIDPTMPPTATATATPTATATAEPTETPEPSPTPTDEAPVVPAEVSEPEPTATLPPAPEPTVLPTEEPTLAPTATAEPTLSPTQTPEPEPTQPPTQAPTATSEPAPATETAPIASPTVERTETTAPTATATLEPTATPSPSSTPTPEATPTATPTEKPSFPAQNATLRQGELPAQAFTSGPVRYTVEVVVRGAQIDSLQLTPVQGAEWVVVVVHAENWSDDDVTLNGASLQLLSYGLYGAAGVVPDPVSNVIAETLGLEPAVGVDVAIPTGGGQRVALAYLIRPDTTDLQLTTGVTTIDLAAAMGQAVSLTDLGEEPEAPRMVQAEVVEVLDGESIVVQTEDGSRAQVRYLGIQAPLGDACYAAESTSINAALVQGQTVYLERERKNRAPNSRIARDVWVKGADGKLTLVSAALAAAGSVVPAPVEPDVRFAGWIQAAADGAQYNLYGLWGACGGLQAPPPEQSAAPPQTADPAQAVPVEADLPAQQVIEQTSASLRLFAS